MKTDEERWAEWQQFDRLAGRAAGQMLQAFLVAFLGTLAVFAAATALFVIGLLVLLLIGMAL